MTYDRFDRQITSDNLYRIDNLNELPINNADGPPVEQSDFQAISVDGHTRVLFKDLDRQLCRLISRYHAAVGCVAWLTHPGILTALSMLREVSIIVQKEDFLRPDSGVANGWKAQLRRQYEALADSDRGTHSLGYSYCSDPTLAAVRCVGNYNRNREAAFPRSHHKFLVLGNIVKKTERHGGDGDEYETTFDCFEPQEVWTGSFNFTFNATNSFENVVVSTDPNIVMAFYREWGQVVAFSEALNWESEWVHPEYRIGT